MHTMSDPLSPETAPPPAYSGPAGIALMVAGIVLMVAGQGILHMPAMACAGLAVLAVGVVLGVISQRGK
jgi:hypothetical protein